MVRNLCLKLVKFCVFLSLSNAKESGGGRLPLGARAARFLAEALCADLEGYMFTDQESADACPETFNNVDSESSLSSEVKVQCRWSAESLQLETAPSSLWQAVVLVPDKEEEAPISYTVIWPGSSTSELEVSSPRASYSLYASALRVGRAPAWRRQAAVPAWDRYRSRQPQHQEYDVQVQFVNYTRSGPDERVTAVMTWNHTGDADACFTVTNYCEELMSTDVTEARATLPRLPLGRACRVEVVGLHGASARRYRTPPARLLVPAHANTDVSSDASLQVPKIVFVEAQERGAGWAVRVAWAAPARAPDRYTLVLTADRQHTLNVSGNATEAVVDEVTGEGVYNVSLYAYRGARRAHTFRRAVFIGSTGWGWVGAVGGAWAAVALGLLGLALRWLRLRGRRLADEKLKDEESKPVEEFLLTLQAECDDQWEIKSERLTLHEVVGEGAFGSVRRGLLAPEGKEVAVKMLRDFPRTEDLHAFRLEMEVMKSVGAHAHVVSLLGFCSGARPLIVQEYCAKGDLLQYLRAFWDAMLSRREAKYYVTRDPFKMKVQRENVLMVVNQMYERGLGEPELTAADLLSFCRQIAIGMEFLAHNRLVHRDLAARNVLVASDRTLKIADFGLARDVYEENQYKMKSNGKMPFRWMAPESLERKLFTTHSDVWSFGVTMWEVVTLGASPYQGVPAPRLQRMLLAGYRMPRPVNCTKELYEVMLSCWHASARARPCFAALHGRLDELLQAACAGDYLQLELVGAAPPAASRLASLAMIMRGRRSWTREPYLPPRPRGNDNLYSDAPVTLHKAPA